MNLDDALKQTAVIGAAGKMGSGISLLLLEELALVEAQKTGQVGKGEYRLDLIDVNSQALDALRVYLRTHLTRMAERQINQLRKVFAGNDALVSNEQIVNAFVEGAMNIIHTSTEVEEAKDAVLVFEAVVEDLQIKTNIYRKLVDGSEKVLYVFTNTSSIPIHVLNDSAELRNRIIGFHFYNPPSVQRLVELIPLENGEPLLYEWAYELAKRLKKRLVLSRDVAGFIGNGFLLREALFACAKVRELAARYPLHQAIYMVNKVSQEFLLRPMGIFQLLDYVGLDVSSRIGQVMNTYLPCGCYDDALIDSMVQGGIVGGQYPDGSQKSGFFEYDKGQLVGVYSQAEKRYIPLSEGAWRADADKVLGSLPAAYASWRVLHKEQNPDTKVRQHFEELSHMKTLGADLARAFLYRDGEISRALVADGIAHHADDVKAVMQNGFYHLYGPEEAIRTETNASCAS